MIFRPKPPLGRHFEDGSGRGNLSDRFDAMRSAAAARTDVTTEIPIVRPTQRPDDPPRRRRGAAREDRVRQTGQLPRVQPEQRPEQTEPPQEEQKSVARSSAIMFLGTLVSRVLGLVRSPILLGAVVSVNAPVANSFDVANKLPNLIYMVIIGGLVNAVLVPAIVRATKQSDDDGQAFINKLLTVAIVLLGLATLVITLAAPLVVKLFASTMDAPWFDVTVAFAYWCLPQIFFYGMYTVLGQILNARENFGPYMWAPALNNVIAILGLVLILGIYGSHDPATAGDTAIWDGTRIAMLGGVHTLGIIMQAVILIWPLRRLGFSYRPDFKWRGSGLGDAGRASWWILLSMIGGMVPTMVQSNMAAGATARAQQMGIPFDEVAGNATYTSAYTIYSIPTSLIVVSISTAMFTRLAKHAADRNMVAMRRDTSKTLRMVSTLMLLCTVLIVVLAVPASRFIAPTIAPEATITLSRVLIAMALGLVSIGAVNVLDRAFYAFEDTRLAFILNLPFQVLGVIGFAVCGLLPPQWVVVGIGLVMTLTNTGAAFLLGYALRGKMGRIDGKRILITHLKLLAISLVVGLIGILAMRWATGVFHPEASFMSSVLVMIVLAPILTIMYFGLMKLWKMPELVSLEGPARGVLRKLGINK